MNKFSPPSISVYREVDTCTGLYKVPSMPSVGKKQGQNKQYYLRNKENRREAARTKYWENPEKQRARRRASYWENPDKERPSSRAFSQ